MNKPTLLTAPAMLVALLMYGCNDGIGGQSTSSRAVADAPARIELAPADARRTGEAKYKCWGQSCYWVVWCGHRLCDGSWSWRFPASGRYRLTWQAVKHKCAGSPAWEIRINGERVSKGNIPQYGSCHDCAARRGYGEFKDFGLGTYSLRQGDDLTLYVRNDFACGIEGPGAYAAHTSVVADLQR